MLLLWASVLLFLVQAGTDCGSIKPVDKGKEDPCNAKTTPKDCYGEAGCEWFSIFQKTKPKKVPALKPDEIGKNTKLKKIPEATMKDSGKFKAELENEVIMHYNVKAGTVESYSYTPAFLKYYKANEKTVLKAWDRFKIPERKMTQQIGRRLISDLEARNVTNETIIAEYDVDEAIFGLDSRRRLPAGAAAAQETGRQKIRNLPYCGVARMVLQKYFKADADYPNSGDPAGFFRAVGVATLIKADNDRGNFYEYYLTAAHNVYTYDIGVVGADMMDKRRYGRQIKMHRANNHAVQLTVTNPANMLREVWIGSYKFLRNREQDWAILKYQVLSAANDVCASTPGRSADDYGPNGKYELISYRTNKQEYHKPVEVRDSAASIYKVPYYTEAGMSGSPFYEQNTVKLVGIHHGRDGVDSVHMRVTDAQVTEFGRITSGYAGWDQFAVPAIDWNWDQQNGDGLRHARDIHLRNKLMDDFESYDDDTGAHVKSLHHKKSVSGSALDLNIPNHDVNIHHYYHHDDGYDAKYEHDTYSDGYSEYNYNYEQTKLLLAIPLTLFTICIVCIGCLCCAGFGGIAGWFIQHASKGGIKNRKNDYIQALNDNEVSEI